MPREEPEVAEATPGETMEVEHEGAVDTSAGGDSPSAEPETCPASVDERADRTCTEPGRRCDYGDEGDCVCAVIPIVQGVLVTPEYAAERPEPVPTWDCAPRVRADGCPGRPPGGACTVAGQQCGYRAHEPRAICTGGQWMALPPEPVP